MLAWVIFWIGFFTLCIVHCFTRSSEIRAKYKYKNNKEIEAEVPRVLKVIGLEEKANNFPSELSGGEKQRVAIARALVNYPDIIIADEPTGNLDPYNTYEVISLLQKINQAGRTIILATHDREIINKLGKRVITIENGKIIRDEAEGRFII